MKLSFFVSHKFVREDQTVSLVNLRSVVEGAVKRASAGHGEFECDVYYENLEYGEPLPAGIRSRIKACHIFCCDLSGHSSNVLYELGFAHALNKKLIVLLEDSVEATIPSDLTDVTIARYSSTDGFESRLRERVGSIINEFVDLSHSALLEPDHRCQWFVERPSDISIICSPEPEKTRFADPASIGYIFVDNLEDRDALLDVSMYLSRAFPEASIQRHISDGIAYDILDSDLVLLGGQKNNTVTRDFLRLLPVDLTYDLDGMTLTLPSGGSVSLEVKRNDEGLIIEDTGYFGLFANPFRKGKRVAICVGSHTFGTLGAAKVMDDSFQGLKNAALVGGFAADRCFSKWDQVQTLFPVKVMLNRRVPSPVLTRDRIWFG